MIKQNWIKFLINYDEKEFKYVIFEFQLGKKELQNYKFLEIKYYNIFEWSYKDLKNILLSIYKYTILFLLNTILIRKKHKRVNYKMQPIVKKIN